MSSLAQGLKTQARVIEALILRETSTKYGDSKLGFLWALAQPLAFILVFIVIFSAMGRASPLPGDLYSFFLTGMVPFLFFRAISNGIAGSEGANRALLTYPQVTTIDTKIARFIIEFLINLFVCVATYFALLGLGFIKIPINNPLDLIFCILAISVFSFGFGMILSGIFVFWKNFNTLYQAVINRPLFLISGIFFIPEQVPAPYNEFFHYNPIARFIAWARSAVYPSFDSVFGFGWDLVFVTLAVLLLGLVIERLTLKRKLLA